MRAGVFTAFTLGLAACGVHAAPPTFSCFPEPHEGQTNPLGEGMEDVVEEECCEALIDESDIMVERMVVWDPISCNHGPGLTAIAEGPLCRAHDTDGCRFCRETCDGFEGACIVCDEITMPRGTASPTASPTGLGGFTGAPFGIFPETRFPVPGLTPAPVDEVIEAPTAVAVPPCRCVDDLPETEAAVLVARGKTMRCDRSCSDGSDLTWGVLNCNYFAMGQNCRTCADTCVRTPDNTWVDTFGDFCKPCDAIP